MKKSTLSDLLMEWKFEIIEYLKDHTTLNEAINDLIEDYRLLCSKYDFYEKIKFQLEDGEIDEVYIEMNYSNYELSQDELRSNKDLHNYDLYSKIGSYNQQEIEGSLSLDSSDIFNDSFGGLYEDFLIQIEKYEEQLEIIKEEIRYLKKEVNGKNIFIHNKIEKKLSKYNLDNNLRWNTNGNDPNILKNILYNISDGMIFHFAYSDFISKNEINKISDISEYFNYGRMNNTIFPDELQVVTKFKGIVPGKFEFDNELSLEGLDLKIKTRNIKLISQEITEMEPNDISYLIFDESGKEMREPIRVTNQDWILLLFPDLFKMENKLNFTQTMMGEIKMGSTENNNYTKEKLISKRYKIPYYPDNSEVFYTELDISMRIDSKELIYSLSDIIRDTLIYILFYLKSNNISLYLTNFSNITYSLFNTSEPYFEFKNIELFDLKYNTQLMNYIRPLDQFINLHNNPLENKVEGEFFQHLIKLYMKNIIEKKGEDFTRLSRSILNLLQSKSKIFPKDQFSYLFIGMESLVSVSKTDSRFWFSTISSILMFENSSIKINIFGTEYDKEKLVKLLNAAYSIRSTLFHEGKLNQNHNKFKFIQGREYDFLEYVLSEMIQKLMNLVVFNNMTPEEIIQEIKNTIMFKIDYP